MGCGGARCACSSAFPSCRCSFTTSSQVATCGRLLTCDAPLRRRAHRVSSCSRRSTAGGRSPSSSWRGPTAASASTSGCASVPATPATRLSCSRSRSWCRRSRCSASTRARARSSRARRPIRRCCSKSCATGTSAIPSSGRDVDEVKRLPLLGLRPSRRRRVRGARRALGDRATARTRQHHVSRRTPGARADRLSRARGEPQRAHPARVDLRRPRPLHDVPRARAARLRGSLPPARHAEARRARATARADPTCASRASCGRTHDIAVLPLLPPDVTADDPRRNRDSASMERFVAIMFVDIRRSTALFEKRLPYDVVFLLNHYLRRRRGRDRRRGRRAEPVHRRRGHGDLRHAHRAAGRRARRRSTPRASCSSDSPR